MEQQNQQPIQEKTENKLPTKTNWKYLAIVAIVAIILSVGGILLFKATQAPPMEEFTLAPCDLNADGICDAADITLFQQALGTNRGDVDYNPLADADADGVVTAVDQQMLFPVTSPVLQPQTLDTSTWQTYRNDEFGFEMRYPTDWIVEIDALFFQDEIKSSKTESLITILEMENPENLSFDDWVGKVSLLADDPPTRPIGEYATFINGVRAYRFDSYPSDRPFAEISEIFIESPTNRIFNIYATSAVREDRGVVNQILSTFRFTSP